jgi:hypothetical protein
MMVRALFSLKGCNVKNLGHRPKFLTKAKSFLHFISEVCRVVSFRPTYIQPQVVGRKDTTTATEKFKAKRFFVFL